jgi:hypothetical protein
MALPINTLKGVHSVVIDERKIAAKQLSIRIYDKAYTPLMNLVLVTDRATTDVISMMAPPPPSPTITAITFAPPTPTLPDNSPAGAQVAQATVTMSDGSAFSGTYSLADSTGLFAITTAGAIVTARSLTPPDDGTHAATVTATTSNGMTMAVRFPA